jgi:hypothetical protein
MGVMKLSTMIICIAIGFGIAYLEESFQKNKGSIQLVLHSSDGITRDLINFYLSQKQEEFLDLSKKE